MYDGGHIDVAFEEYFNTVEDSINPENYLPFIKDYCFDTGWCDWNNEDDYFLEGNALVKAIDQLKNAQNSEYIQNTLTAIEEFIAPIVRAGKIIHITRT